MYFTTDISELKEEFKNESSDFYNTWVDGSKCKTKKQLFKQFSKQFQFPSYFGKNWDAFNDCMTDLDWLDATAYTLYIAHLDELLPTNDNDFTIFIELLEVIIIEWSSTLLDEFEKLPQQFKVVVQGNTDTEIILKNKLKHLSLVSFN